MIVIERKPRQFEAVQFNKEGDFPGVKRGYHETKGNHVALYISDSYPKSMNCGFCYVLETGIIRSQLNIGDWILVETDTQKRKVVSDKKFQKKYLTISMASKEIVEREDSEARK